MVTIVLILMLVNVTKHYNASINNNHIIHAHSPISNAVDLHKY